MRHSLRTADVFPTSAVRRPGETKAVLISPGHWLRRKVDRGRRSEARRKKQISSRVQFRTYWSPQGQEKWLSKPGTPLFLSSGRTPPTPPCHLVEYLYPPLICLCYSYRLRKHLYLHNSCYCARAETIAPSWACALGIKWCVLRNAYRKSYKYVIDQAWGQGGWILAKFFAAFLWTGTKLRSTKTEKRQERKLFLAEPTREIPSVQVRPILPARVANKNTGFASSCPLADSAIKKLLLGHTQ